jgi:hypothetical protein
MTAPPALATVPYDIYGTVRVVSPNDYDLDRAGNRYGCEWAVSPLR